MKKKLQQVEYDALVAYLEGEEPDDLGLTEDDLPTEEDWLAESYRQRQAETGRGQITSTANAELGC